MKKLIHQKYLAAGAAIAMLSLAAGLRAQTAEPGRLVLHLPASLSRLASKVSRVNVDGPLLQMAASSDHDPQSRQMLSRLKGVYIRDYKFAHPGQYSPSVLNGIVRQLHAPGWQIIVSSSDKTGKQAWIAVRRNSEMITALAIVAAKPTDLAIVNVVGPIDLSQLGALGGLGNLGKLGALGKLAGPKGHPALQHR